MDSLTIVGKYVKCHILDILIAWCDIRQHELDIRKSFEPDT